jgi:hypothetical protein
MSRTVSDFGMQRIFPPAGRYPVSITGIEKGFSQKKKTPQITLVFSDGEVEFDDNLFVTEKTIPRLCLVARRVCGMPDTTAVPDADIDAANFVAKYIMDNALGKKCIVKIDETEETILVEKGPDAGRKKTIKRRRVAYSGYEKYTERNPGEDEMPFPEQSPKSDEEKLPF